jgi:hypothetical protein
MKRNRLARFPVGQGLEPAGKRGLGLRGGLLVLRLFSGRNAEMDMERGRIGDRRPASGSLGLFHA